MSGLGHLGLGLAAKKTVPKIPLIILLLAPELLDIIWAVFYFIGINAVSLSHGLFMSVVWSVIAALVTGLFIRSFRTCLVIGLLVFSHWVVDFITHPMGYIFPGDIGVPLFFEGSPIIGVGLYNTLAGVLIGEALLILPGIVIYIMYLNKKKTENIGGVSGSVD